MNSPKKKAEKRKVGRPTLYTEALADLICERVAIHTLGLQRIIAMYPDMPCEHTINLWRLKHPEFSLKYAQAKLFQAELLAEECLDIADDSRNDWMESLDPDEQGDGWKLNGDHINRCRLRIDTRKFFASKLLPKKYGKAAEEPEKTSEDKKALVAQLLDRLIE